MLLEELVDRSLKIDEQNEHAPSLTHAKCSTLADLFVDSDSSR